MRYLWRVLLLRAQNLSAFHISNNLSKSQVQLNPNLQLLRSLTSLLHPHSINDTISSPFSGCTDFVNPLNPITRDFASAPALEQSEPDHAVIVDIFSKELEHDDVKKELVLNNILVNHDTVLKVLGNLDSSPDVAIRFFKWVLESDSERLSSKSYNLMLGILGVNGLVKEFWDLVEDMKKKGYGVSRGVHDKVLKSFEKGGLDNDVWKLKSLFASGSTDNSTEKICSRVCKIVRHNVWGDDVEKQIRDSNVAFSSEMVNLILENLGTEPSKALIFFRWLEESGKFKHDESTYNAMARVLGREDTIDRFWKVADELRSRGYEMEVDTFVTVLGRFCKRRIMKGAVELYEFAMAGSNKPSPQCCTFLLKKIAADKKLDMSLFSRVVKAFTGSGNMLRDSTVEAILKSLSSVGRTGECTMVLKAMEEGGFVASGNLQSKIAFRLGAGGNKEEVCEFMDGIVASGSSPDHKTWVSLIEGQCELKPRHSTYKLLITRLLAQGVFTHAVKILGIMRSHGFPPFADPFIEHVSKSGTGDDAILFLKEMTSKKFPSNSLFLRMFDAFFKCGRHEEAQNFLSKCPPSIRNNAEVLNLFCSMKSAEGASSGKDQQLVG